MLQLPFALLTKKNVPIIPHISFMQPVPVSGWMQEKCPPHQMDYWKSEEKQPNEFPAL